MFVMFSLARSERVSKKEGEETPATIEIYGIPLFGKDVF